MYIYIYIYTYILSLRRDVRPAAPGASGLPRGRRKLSGACSWIIELLRPLEGQSSYSMLNASFSLHGRACVPELFAWGLPRGRRKLSGACSALVPFSFLIDHTFLSSSESESYSIWHEQGCAPQYCVKHGLLQSTMPLRTRTIRLKLNNDVIHKARADLPSFIMTIAWMLRFPSRLGVAANFQGS